jgi:HD-GYP domain-containing protein (c-di-GMP phosphodiesterase class II)
LAPIIRHHHERYDGTGYPDGLKGQEIPLGSRIICIADAYDTMVTRRAYRNSISQNEALIELERCSGTQFDPEIIKVVFIALSQQTAKDD